LNPPETDQARKLAVSIAEAARLLSVSSRTVQNYLHAKLLPSRKIGRRTVIPMRALENFLRTDQPSPSGEASVRQDEADEVRQ
jgi:excisionase family DNA binding protein